MEVIHRVSILHGPFHAPMQRLINFRACTGVKFQCAVNAAADAVTLYPLEPMSPISVAASFGSELTDHITSSSHSSANSAAQTPSTTTTVASPPATDAADHKASSKDKVPRPPNAFIIYRKEWHPKVVKENPNLHNNEICKSILHAD